MTTDRKIFIHWAWIILGTCFVNLFINYSVRLGYSVILPEMIKDLGFSRTAGGSIFNAYLFVYISLAPLTGYLTDRLGARRVIATCALILGVGVFLMGTVKSLWMACFFYAVAGLGATGMWTPVITVVQRWFIPRRRGFALGILSTGYGLGFATMGIAFPWIVQNFSWRFSWYFLGAGALVMMVVNSVFLRSSPEAAGTMPWGQDEKIRGTDLGKSPSPRSVSFSKAIWSRNFWLIGMSYFAVSYGLYGFTTFMVDYAKYQLNLPLEKASLIATVHGICQVFGVLTLLPLSDYLGRKRTVIISNSFITLCLLGVVFVGNSTEWLFVIVGIMAVFYGITFPIYGACAGDYFPKEVMGTVIGAWTPFYGLGAIIVHWVNGILRDTLGRYDEAFLINACAAAFGILLFLGVKKVQGDTKDSGNED